MGAFNRLIFSLLVDGALQSLLVRFFYLHFRFIKQRL